MDVLKSNNKAQAGISSLSTVEDEPNQPQSQAACLNSSSTLNSNRAGSALKASTLDLASASQHNIILSQYSSTAAALKMAAYFQPTLGYEDRAKKTPPLEITVTSSSVSSSTSSNVGSSVSRNENDDPYSYYFVLLEKIQRDFKHQSEQGAFSEELSKCQDMMADSPVGSKLYRRCKIITTATQVNSVSEWVSINNLNAKTLRKWLLRFINQGCNGLYDQERPGRPRKAMVSSEVLQELLANPPCLQPDYFYENVSKELQETLKKNIVWNVTLLAQAIGVSRSTMYKLLRKYQVVLPESYSSINHSLYLSEEENSD